VALQLHFTVVFLLESCNVIADVCVLKFICSLLENLPDDVSPGQAIWCPNDLGVICVGWWHVPYRLGLIYCTQRRSALFHIDLKNYTCTTLGPTDHSVSNPVFSHDQTKLVFLENDAGGPHRQCSRLAMCDWYAFRSLMSYNHTSVLKLIMLLSLLLTLYNRLCLLLQFLIPGPQGKCDSVNPSVLFFNVGYMTTAATSTTK